LKHQTTFGSAPKKVVVKTAHPLVNFSYSFSSSL